MLALQIAACAVTLTAAWLIGNKRLAGPALNAVAALLFAVINASAELWVCAAFSLAMAAVNLRNVVRWHRAAAPLLILAGGIGLALMFSAPPARAEAMVASFYGSESGSRTASGERFHPGGMTAAHRTLPFGTRLRVCRHGCVVVTVNDRGPFVRGRQLDLAEGAARAIGLTGAGVGRVDVSRE